MKKEILLMMLVLMAVLATLSVVAVDPEGASITYVSNSSKVAGAAGSRMDAKGQIHTIRLNAENQNLKWKAYIGNVSSTFVLDDADGYSIYQWQLGSSYQYSGQVYVSRDSSVTWAGIACATRANKVTEDGMLGHTTTNKDSINSTFTAQTHRSFSVAGQSINQNTCFATATWVNDTSQTLTTTIPFQEVILWEGTEMVYTTFLENRESSYRNDSVSHRVDFQLIIPDNATSSSSPETYYFYLELI